MTPSEAILAGVNKQIGFVAMLREFLAHTDWHMTATGSLMSSEAARALVEQEDASVAISKVENLEEMMINLDPSIAIVRVDPSSPISLSIETDRLEAFRRLARGARVERALAEGTYTVLKAFDAYFVPYFGELGNEYQVIALPTPHGKMVAAFTAEDRVDAFLATGNDTDRANVKFVRLSGEQLFGSAGSLGQGVIVNFGSENPVGFMLDACKDVMASDAPAEQSSAE